MSDRLQLESREGVWYAVGTFNGKRIRTSLRTRDKVRAKEQLALYEAKLWKRHNYGEEAVRTFEEAAESYLRQGGEGRFLPRVLKHFKGRTLGTISPGEVRDMAISLYPRASASTRNRQGIVPAQAVINHGHSRHWCGPIKVDLFEVPKSRKHKPVSGSWLATFLAQCDKDGLAHLAALVLFMNHTAARVSEAIGLLGEHVDLDGRVCVLAKTKTDEWHPRYLTAELVLRMGALGIEDGQPVFRYTDRCAVNRRIAAVCKRAGLDARTTHSAGRHSFATNAMASDAKVKDAMEAGGWKSAKLFLETYVHSDDAGRAVAKIFDTKAGLIGAESAQQKPKQRYHFGKKR